MSPIVVGLPWSALRTSPAFSQNDQPGKLSLEEDHQRNGFLFLKFMEWFLFHDVVALENPLSETSIRPSSFQPSPNSQNSQGEGREFVPGKLRSTVSLSPHTTPSMASVSSETTFTFLLPSPIRETQIQTKAWMKCFVHGASNLDQKRPFLGFMEVWKREVGLEHKLSSGDLDFPHWPDHG